MSDPILSAGLGVQQEQRQHLSLNMRRSLELLALPLAELDLQLTAELQVNPLLEENIVPVESPELPEKNSGETEDENDFESRIDIADQWREHLPLPDAGGDDDEHWDYINSLPAAPPPLRAGLIREIATMELPEKLCQCAMEIVFALDDDGYLKTPLADLAMICDAGLNELEKALRIVQEIAPAGVGARDLPECLKLQLLRRGQFSVDMEKLLAGGVAELENNRPDILVKKLGVSPEKLAEMLKLLRSLNPFPGRQNSDSGAVVIPDLVISRTPQGNYTAALRSFRRDFIISERYIKMLADPSLDPETRAYLAVNHTRAKELLKAIELRGTTLKRLGDMLAEVQAEFFDRGVEFLKPLTMKQAAGILEVSESTVSRAVAEKYAETPQGVLPLKFFFSGGIESGQGDLSNQAVMEKIRQLVELEDPKSPLSDDAIARELKKSGIAVARRTVAKYRDILKIPASKMRKKFF